MNGRLLVRDGRVNEEDPISPIREERTAPHESFSPTPSLDRQAGG